MVARPGTVVRLWLRTYGLHLLLPPFLLQQCLRILLIHRFECVLSHQQLNQFRGRTALARQKLTRKDAT